MATQEAAKGTKVTISGQTLTLRQDIPFGHKVALCDIAEGKSVIKYGAAIGHATETIHIGDWVHMHNMTTDLSGQLEYSYHPQKQKSSGRIAERADTFEG